MTDSNFPWVTDITPGHGHRGAIRNGNLQAVLPRFSDKWDIFENGRCLETGLTESEARVYLTTYLTGDTWNG